MASLTAPCLSPGGLSMICRGLPETGRRFLGFYRLRGGARMGLPRADHPGRVTHGESPRGGSLPDTRRPAAGIGRQKNLELWGRAGSILGVFPLAGAMP